MFPADRLYKRLKCRTHNYGTLIVKLKVKLHVPVHPDGLILSEHKSEARNETSNTEMYCNKKFPRLWVIPVGLWLKVLFVRKS